MPDTTTRWHHTTWLLEAPFYNKYDAIARGKQKTAQKVDLQSTHSGIKSILRSWSGYYRKTLGTAAPQRGNSPPQIRLYTSLLRESYKGEKWTSTGHSSEQYWFVICTGTGRSSEQYWSTQWPVLVEKPTLHKRIPASSPTRFSFTQRHVVYWH